MEGITLFISIIFIVFGILQIVLFFKMWGMTNNMERLTKDVNKLTRHFCDDDEERAEGYYDKGEAYRADKNLDKAIEYYNKAIEFDKEHAYAYHMLADIYMEKNMLDEALTNANKAIDILSKRIFFSTRLDIYEKLAEKETNSTKIAEYQKLAEADMEKYNELYNQ